MLQSKSIIGLVGVANRSTDEDWSIIVDALRDVMVEKKKKKKDTSYLNYFIIGIIAVTIVVAVRV
jgi:hypothetical protein